jgi:PAS domain S-box-containing protein
VGVAVRAAAAGETEVGHWTFAKADGARIPVELSVSALRGGASGITGFLLVAGDITERLRAEEDPQALAR